MPTGPGWGIQNKFEQAEGLQLGEAHRVGGAGWGPWGPMWLITWGPLPQNRQTDRHDWKHYLSANYACACKNPQQSVLQQNLFINSDDFLKRDVDMLRCVRQMKDDFAFVIHCQYQMKNLSMRLVKSKFWTCGVVCDGTVFCNTWKKFYLSDFAGPLDYGKLCIELSLTSEEEAYLFRLYTFANTGSCLVGCVATP